MKYLFILFILLTQIVFGQQQNPFKDDQRILKMIESIGLNKNMLLHKEYYLDQNYQLNFYRKVEGELIKSDTAPELQNKIYLFVPQINIRSDFANTYSYFTAFDQFGKKLCGTEHFHLMKKSGQWFIIDFTQTIFDNCQSIEKKETEIKRINASLDLWHGLAAVGDSAYFDSFSQKSFYLGTDPKEVWSLEEFKAFALPHFRRGSAWSFKTKDRNVYLGDYGHYAWFDEILDTWMGLCRGTGVLEKQSDGWKIRHYSLTVLVPNKKINQYIKIIKEE